MEEKLPIDERPIRFVGEWDNGRRIKWIYDPRTDEEAKNKLNLSTITVSKNEVTIPNEKEENNNNLIPNMETNLNKDNIYSDRIEN